MKRRSVWVTLGVIIAIILLLYWLFMAETLEETVALNNISFLLKMG